MNFDKTARLQAPLLPLPLDDAWPDLAEALGRHRNLVLVAEPGAGKTTRFPPRLIAAKVLSPSRPKLLMLEPRRLAARAAAHRIAEEQGWQVGQEVGYQVRFENRTSSQTILTVLTEGLLTRKLQSDPELKDVGAVLLDEFHERSQHTDLALGLLFELQELSRPDLRIIVMSATLDAERIAKFLGDCPIVNVPGRTHPVEIVHAKRPLEISASHAFLDSVSEATVECIEGTRKRHGDVLVFLPGAREIRGVGERVGARAQARGFSICELHGSLSLDEQDRAIKKLDRPKVILATNIAETSLTIDGVGTVIDSGLARVMRVDQLGFPRLELSRISLASATQRAGRAGRQGPGLCYRLWNKLDESSMSPFELPEILRSDLSEALLALAAQGISDPAGFSWFEPPRAESLEYASRLVRELGFIGHDGTLTSLGREALKLPVPVRLAKLLLEAGRENQVTLASRLAALLSEKDIVMNAREAKRHARGESDILLRLGLLGDATRAPEVDRFAARNALRVADLLSSAVARVDLGKMPRASGWSRGLSEDETASRLLLLAFPDRLARRRRAKEPAARMVGGRGVVLAPFSTVETSELFVVLGASEPAAHSVSGAKGDLQVTIASRVEKGWIDDHFPGQVRRDSKVVFNSETLAVQKQTAQSFRDLSLEEPSIARPSSDEAHAALIAACRERWSTAFLSHPGLKRFIERRSFVIRELPDEAWTALDSIEDSVLAEVCFGETKLADVLAKALEDVFLRHLPPVEADRLREFAPETFQVPSGNRIRIEYPEGRAPFLEVRIQEVFGLKATPKLARGRVPVVFHLLGPNFRPVQVTADLESFWKNGYLEVRKELRARYPKHSWPEDPLTAPPQAKGGRRQR